jgi:hypothetical protein
MARKKEIGHARLALWLTVLAGLVLGGCQTLMKGLGSKLGKWNMLGQEAMEDPIRAVGGDGVVFCCKQTLPPKGRKELASASPEALVSYYTPIFIQQCVDTHAQRFPYPPEYDRIGTAHLRYDDKGKLKSYVAGEPTVYAILRKLPLEGHEHVQITYTAWYPAHPRMKAIDLEAADVDSCVVRLTLDAENVPLFYETIAACGCFHKVFVEHWVEELARQTYGPPEPKKQYCVERTVKESIDWEVAGVVDEPHDRPGRPVILVKAGDHKVLGVGSSARLRVPPGAENHPYELASYADLYTVAVDACAKTAPFFDMQDGGKVRGAQRKEKFLFSLTGVDAAGQPRADDQIKMHFDQSTWGDPTIYAKYLRLPLGTL